MTDTVDSTTRVPAARLERAAGIELLGPVQGSGYRQGSALVRRADGQMVHVGPLMYAALECMGDGRDAAEVAAAMSEQLGRPVGPHHVEVLAEKLARQGLLAGTEHEAPPRRNPLLALRWRVMVTGEDTTRRLTAPFTFLFRPIIMWPVLAAFVWVVWFVLFDKGVAGATAQAFHSPGLLLLVFGLTVVSAGFHELGHAAACRYAGGKPGGMGMGLYLVWPAFYTDVTDAYRLPRRDRLRIDLAGLYFNAVVAVATMVVWLFWRVDALLLLVALQVLQMVKQLSPVIRADGYHILSDATGVPDLYSHMGPTLRRLLPGHRNEPAALRGWPRLLVTAWVLVVIPVMLSLLLGAVLLLPHLLATSWASGSHLVSQLSSDASNTQVVGLAATLLELVALILPVVGSALVTQKVLRTSVAGALKWSDGRPGRRLAATLAAAAVVAGLAWAWWPAGQYSPVRSDQKGTIGSLLSQSQPAAPLLPPGTRLAVSMVPVNGATSESPAYLFLPGAGGHPPVAIIAGGAGGTVFPFALPSAPGPGGNQALAVNTQNGGVVYKVAYSLVTISDGAPVANSNSAFAVASCRGCTTVAVAFQVVLVVGESTQVTPINAAGAVNYKCPACVTTAIADQIVVTLSSQPTATLVAQLDSALQQLGVLSKLGANGTPQAIASQVAAVQSQIQSELQQSGQLTTATTEPVTATTQATTATTSQSGTSPTTTASTSGSTSEPSASTTTTSTTVASTTTTTGGG